MAKNKIKEVVQLLGLELNEEFELESASNRYKFTDDGLMWQPSESDEWYPSFIISDLILGNVAITKLPKSILDEKEKEYLSSVIKPFRDRIISIRKYKYSQDEYIGIYVKYYAETDESEMITLPLFKEGTIYKGIELKKYYTLEELGL